MGRPSLWQWKYIFFTAVTYFYFTLAQAQIEYCNKPKKEAKKYFEQAEKMRFRGDKSYFLLKKAVQADEEFAEPLVILGEINQKKYLNASQMRGRQDKGVVNFENRMLEYYQEAISLCPEIENHRLLYVLGEHYYQKKEYAAARPYLSDYIANRKGDKNNQLLNRAEMYLKNVEEYFEILNNPVPFEPVIVRGVSSDNDEYLPMLSPDNKYLFFTQKKALQKGSLTGEEKEIFTQGRNNYDGSFGEIKPLPSPFNQGQYQGGSTMSVDNKLMFVTVINYVNVGGYGFPNGDIYYSEFHNGQWTPLRSAGPNINSAKIWEGQPSISADNNTLYFSRAIDKIIPGEHYGLMDIYKSERQPDGSWGPAVNLGPEINTSGNEKSPFMHSDSYTLYFASDEHIGIGGFDIFYSKMSEDGEFHSLKNLGYPINTEEDEHGFIVSTDGRKGYFSSKMEGVNLDIYSFQLYEEARPEHVVFVKGETIAKMEALEGLEIKLKNVVSNKEINAVLDKETGEYVGVIAVKEDEDVLLTAKKDGYAFSSQYISSDENVVGKPIAKELEIKEIKKGESYKIKNIVFATNSYALDNRVKAILDEFADFLKRNQNLVVALHGHTDDVGDDQNNMELSENRAKAVAEYIASKGVKSERLSSKGFGETKPIADNKTPEGRAENRRTEFVVISE